MKVLLCLLLITFTLSASHVRWYGDFDTAHKEALKQNKILMVLLIKKECLACQEALKTAFINQPYIDEINERFIAVLITKDQKNSYPIEMLYTFAYPSLFFLNRQELFICEPLRGDLSAKKVKYLVQSLF